MMISFAKRESHVITQAKKYVPPKDERTLAKGLSKKQNIQNIERTFKETNAKVAAKKKPAGDEEEPAATIYVENLPDEANESMLNLLFSQFPGFKKSRPIPAGGKGKKPNWPLQPLGKEQDEYLSFSICRICRSWSGYKRQRCSPRIQSYS